MFLSSFAFYFCWRVKVSRKNSPARDKLPYLTPMFLQCKMFFHYLIIRRVWLNYSHVKLVFIIHPHRLELKSLQMLLPHIANLPDTVPSVQDTAIMVLNFIK